MRMHGAHVESSIERARTGPTAHVRARGPPYPGKPQLGPEDGPPQYLGPRLARGTHPGPLSKFLTGGGPNSGRAPEVYAIFLGAYLLLPRYSRVTRTRARANQLVRCPSSLGIEYARKCERYVVRARTWGPYLGPMGLTLGPAVCIPAYVVAASVLILRHIRTEDVGPGANNPIYGLTRENGTDPSSRLVARYLRSIPRYSLRASTPEDTRTSIVTHSSPQLAHRVSC